MRSAMRAASATMVVTAVALVVLAASASATNTQLSGVAVFDGMSSCPSPPDGYSDFTDFTLIMPEGQGSLDGCWYTKIDASSVTPSNVYLERGREVFVGCLNDGTCGSFATTYKFTSKWAGEPFLSPELHGRCQHPVVGGSGTGGFEGVTGRVDFKDDVTTGDLIYRGHLKLADDV
jgi:hypothetical protein